MPSSTLTDRRQAVEQQLRALGRPRGRRRAPPPDGRLGEGEQSIARLRAVCENLGPVFTEFGRYLSSRVDLLPRRDCLELEATGARPEARHPADGAAILRADFGATPEMLFASFSRSPRVVTRWTQQHDACLSTDTPVIVTIIRPDAAALLDADLPLLPMLAPWLDAPPPAVAAAVEDFSLTLRHRLDQTEQLTAFTRLTKQRWADGLLDAPRCYPEMCSGRVLTVARVDGPSLATAIVNGGVPPPGDAIDPAGAAKQLAAGWVRLAVSSRSVLFDFDLNDVVLCDGRLVLVGGAIEPMTETEGPEFLTYLLAGAIDDPDRALDWIATSASAGSLGLPEESLRRRLRQAVPFRDGEWSGDDRLAQRLFVHWRTTRAAGWQLPAHYLRLYRGVHALSAATTTLAPNADHVLTALQDEQWRLGSEEARNWLDADRLAVAMEGTARDLVQIPKKLDEILTAAAAGRLRITAEVPDPGERRIARNRTVSLVASLVTLVALTFLTRHLSPALGSSVEWIAALVVLLVGGWLLIAASRL